MQQVATLVTITKLVGKDVVTSSRLTDELSLGNYDLVHYAGHAGFDRRRPERSFLLLPNGERYRAERVQRLIEGHPIVFLNACESSRSGTRDNGGWTASSMASRKVWPTPSCTAAHKRASGRCGQFSTTRPGPSPARSTA